MKIAFRIHSGRMMGWDFVYEIPSMHWTEAVGLFVVEVIDAVKLLMMSLAAVSVEKWLILFPKCCTQLKTVVQ